MRARGPEPYGGEALLSLHRLGNLRLDTFAGQTSSYGRDGGNFDGFGASNYLYVDGNGEKVMTELDGPGTIYVMWFTGYDPVNAWIKVYIDGETTPRLHRPVHELVAGLHAPFEWPLSMDADASSGGFVVHVPIPFARSIKITTNGAGGHFFYHVGYHVFPADRAVVSFTGEEDLTAARQIWDATGGRPTAIGPDETTDRGTLDVAAHTATTLAEIEGPAQITGLTLKVPGVTGGGLTDGGRAHLGRSGFRMRIDPANQGVVLRRRIDGFIADQQADVVVDGAVVGRWHTPGAAAGWRDTEFTIPAAATAGKSAIGVEIVYVSSAVDWNEFEYRALSIVDGVARLTDVLDVGIAGSEAQHEYTITGETFLGRRTLTYPADGADARALLEGLRLRITWDDQAEAAVFAPLGSFFSVGAFGPGGQATALPVGMDSTGLLYVYFPMPFGERAEIEIVSTGPAVAGVAYELSHGPLAQAFSRMGYFRTEYRVQDLGNDGRDVGILDVGGHGHFVGLVESLSGPTHRWFLEGDERFYVDGSLTPAFQGTGSEDFYQGGWYFDRETFGRMSHGNPVHRVEGDRDLTVAYRLFLADLIPFRNGLRLGIEHGPANDIPVHVTTLAWYYHRDGDACPVSDELDVGDAGSESDHGYAIVGETASGPREATFEGDDDTVVIADSVRSGGGSSFTLAVDPANEGVLLRRRFDQAAAGPVAEVWVDGALVGPWRYAGTNGFHAWREEDLFIPAAHTAGKASLAIEIRVAPGAPAWSEARYWAMSCHIP